MKTKSLFRMIVALVTVMLLSCISTSAYAKNYAGTYTFTDASKKTYTMVLKPGKIIYDDNYQGKGVLYYKGKIVDYLSWKGYDYCSINHSDVKILFPNGDKDFGYLYIKGGYLYKEHDDMNAEHPKKRLKLTKK